MNKRTTPGVIRNEQMVGEIRKKSENPRESTMLIKIIFFFLHKKNIITFAIQQERMGHMVKVKNHQFPFGFLVMNYCIFSIFLTNERLTGFAKYLSILSVLVLAKKKKKKIGRLPLILTRLS